MSEKKPIRCNFWLLDCLTTDETPVLLGVCSTHPITVADCVDYLERNTTLSIVDIWTSDAEELEFAEVEVLRI